MRMHLVATLAGLALLLATGPMPAQPPGDDAVAASEQLTLRRVMLSTGGVGYFEYETQVTGNAALAFRVRRDQVDDVLKSVVVYDDDGRIGRISLPGQEPLREAFRGLPFEPDDLASPVTLFNALRGAEVRVTGPREITGRLLAVVPETTELADGGRTTRHRVSLVTATGVQQLVLEEVGALAFTNAELSAQLEAALTAMARHDDPDTRTLTATLEGEGERTVRVAYVVEVPLWKATYRLTLDNEPGAETAALQGWAVLENLSGEDWPGVELSVVSGNPVTFRQALYQAYYVHRPEVPVEVLGRVLPPADPGGVAAEAPIADMAMAARQRAQGAAALELGQSELMVTGARPARLAETEALGAATQVIFRVPRPVSVAAGESVLVPIAEREIPAERLSVYRRDTHPRHPLASVRVTNDTGTGLPPGVLTLYERDTRMPGVSFIGDARLATVPAGAGRLLSFAVDEDVTIDHDARETRAVQRGRIVDGVLEISVIDRLQTRYLVGGALDEDRRIIIEHPRRSGWELAGHEDVEMTDTIYRLPLDVNAGETVRLDAVLERPQLQRIELADLDLQRIQTWVAADELSEEIRAALRELAGHRERMAEIDRSVRTAERARESLVSDQERLRENLAVVPRDSDLSRRYLDELATQEDRLAELAGQIDALREARREAEEQLSAHVRELRLE